MENKEELLAHLALNLVPNIGSVLVKNLIAYCGSASQVFKTPKGKLMRIPLVGEERANSILDADVKKMAEAELKFIEDYKIETLLFTEENFPQRLKEISDSPALLFYKGSADLNAQKIVAVVGTRKITDYGKEITRKIIDGLRAQNILVVSGLAYGVDIAAHSACVDANIETVGVLAHGLNRIYPPQHTSIAKKMVESGGLVTEFSTQDKFHPANFPQRNKIIAGLSDAVIVIESDIKGGAVITANMANLYNKDVFAVPGRVSDKYSSGCNFLIKTFKANILHSAQDLLEFMNWKTDQATPKRLQLTIPLTPQEQKIYAILKEKTEVEIDQLSFLSGLSNSALASLLLEMEMNNLIASLPGKRYRLVFI